MKQCALPLAKRTVSSITQRKQHQICHFHFHFLEACQSVSQLLATGRRCCLLMGSWNWKQIKLLADMPTHSVASERNQHCGARLGPKLGARRWGSRSFDRLITQHSAQRHTIGETSAACSLANGLKQSAQVQYNCNTRKILAFVLQLCCSCIALVRTA